MSNQNEKNDALEKKLTRVTLLQQTTLDKLEILGQKLNNRPTEGGEDLKDQFSSFLDTIKANHQVCMSKFVKVDEGNKNCLSAISKIPDYKTRFNEDMLYALASVAVKTNYWRNLFYLVSFVGGLSLIILGVYSFKYYRMRGDAVKYEFMRSKGNAEVKDYIKEIDADYDKRSYKTFKSKYLND